MECSNPHASHIYGALSRLSWIVLLRRPQTRTVDRSCYKLRITTSYNHSMAAKNTVPRIWEGDGMEHKHTTSNKSQQKTLATKTEYNDHGNIENRPIPTSNVSYSELSDHILRCIPNRSTTNHSPLLTRVPNRGPRPWAHWYMCWTPSKLPNPHISQLALTVRSLS